MTHIPYPYPPTPSAPPVVPRPPVPIFGPPTPFLLAWPRDIRSAMTRNAILAATVAGIAGALCWRSTIPGIGWTLTILAVAVAAFVSQRVRWTPTRIAAVVLGLCLAVVPSVRDAGWLVDLAVLGALALFVYSLAPARTWTGIAMGQLIVAMVPGRVVGWMRRGTRRMARGRRVDPDRVAIVVVITAALLAGFGLLLASADARFKTLLSNIAPFVSAGDVIGRTIVGLIVGGFALAAIYVLSRPPVFDKLTEKPVKKLPRWEWATPLAALNLLFIAFVVVQISVLFGGDEHVQVTEGLTYAEYARQGFWQLLWVTILVLGVIALAIRVAGREAPRDRLYVRVLVGGLCVTTLVIVISAIHRMSLYEKAYGFSVERLLVRWIEVGMGLVLVLILVAGIKMSARWLPTAVIGIGALGLLGLAVMNPEGYVAQRNIEWYQQSGRIDQWYLSRLSSDAVPALQQLPADVRECVLPRIKEHLPSSTPWYEYNSSRSIAGEATAGMKSPRCKSDSSR